MEVYAGNIQIALSGIKGKVVVVDSPRLVVLKIVHDDAVAVHVEDVGKSFVAPLRHHIDKLSSLEIELLGSGRRKFRWGQRSFFMLP